MTCQESWSSGKKSGQCVVAGTGHGVIPKYVFVCLAPLQLDECYIIIICAWILEKRSKSHIRSFEINGFKELKPA